MEPSSKDESDVSFGILPSVTVAPLPTSPDLHGSAVEVTGDQPGEA
jgi:hypothetical protein